MQPASVAGHALPQRALQSQPLLVQALPRVLQAIAFQHSHEVFIDRENQWGAGNGSKILTVQFMVLFCGSYKNLKKHLARVLLPRSTIWGGNENGCLLPDTQPGLQLQLAETVHHPGGAMNEAAVKKPLLCRCA